MNDADYDLLRETSRHIPTFLAAKQPKLTITKSWSHFINQCKYYKSKTNESTNCLVTDKYNLFFKFFGKTGVESFTNLVILACIKPFFICRAIFFPEEIIMNVFINCFDD